MHNMLNMQRIEPKDMQINEQKNAEYVKKMQINIQNMQNMQIDTPIIMQENVKNASNKAPQNAKNMQFSWTWSISVRICKIHKKIPKIRKTGY